MIKGSKTLIHSINSNILLETIINSDTISRAGLSKKLGLTKATVSTIAQELLSKHLILEIGSEDTHFGRKPILLTFHRKAGYIISIDLGQSSTTAILSDLFGEKIKLQKIRTPDKEHLLRELIELTDSLMKVAPDSPYGLAGITIGVHGASADSSFLALSYYDVFDIPLAEEMSSYFHVKVQMENASNLAALGDHAFGYSYPNLAEVTIYNGVGLGLIINNHLYHGFSGHAGEIGHTIVEPLGKPCPCGNLGCLEQYLSEKALLAEFSKKKNLPSVSFQEYLNHYLAKDNDALFTASQFVHYMTITVNNILSFINPDVLVINSSFTNLIPELIPKIEANLSGKEHLYLKIVPSLLKDTACLLGGVYVVLQEFLGIREVSIRK